MRTPIQFRTLVIAVLALAAVAAAAEPPRRQADRPAPADALVASLEPEALRLLAAEVLERNPGLAALRAEAARAAQVAPQVKALPDPVAGLTAYLLTPETRVGPQYATATLSQRFPWFGKLPTRERAALAAAAAAAARVEARRLELVTQVRTLAMELAFLDAWEREVRADRSILGHYEELARARYAAGVGLSQAVVKIQAEITRDDTRLVEIATRRATLVARINGLRDRPEHTPVPSFELPAPGVPPPVVAALRRAALERRPELAAEDAEIARAEALIELARLEYKPDVTAGLRYTLVGSRDDRAARISRPEEDGKDVLGLFASINLPIRKEKLAAGVEEAVQRRLTAEARRRDVVAGIEADLGDLVQRIRLETERLRLFRDVLIRQAEESLRSAEAAYAAGRLAALDLLDAERVLLDVRTAAARSQADLAVAIARLEGVVGSPLEALTITKENQR